MDSVDAIKREFQAGELSHIDAIQRLEKLGNSSEDAEAIVYSWSPDED